MHHTFIVLILLLLLVLCLFHMMANEEAITTAADEHQLNRRYEYDVFLCFKRLDTLNGFTGNLYNALRRKKFKVFMDVDGFKRGDQILASLFSALEGSRISIVVLSKNFAYSTYCLDELVKMLEYRNTKNQLILPIFYDVDPSEVRHHTRWYGYAMTAHERRLGKDSEKWKSALLEVANLKGCHFKPGHEYEYEFIQRIVEWVTNALPRYHVFLSFSEEDIRYSFTGYLYDALVREGFKTFMKDEGWEDGDQNSQSLVTAIEKSTLSIIVLSENYAYSPSCLDELVTILHFMKIKNQLVWPIFYKVEPSDIRHQRKSYGEAMTKHENIFGKDSEKVQIWRSALFEVANLKGWHLKFGYEYDLIEKIVETAIKI